jgi:hypothetical protein
MKRAWEYGIKPQFKLDNSATNEYTVAVPAEAFESSDINDSSRKPFIRNECLNFAR